MFSNLFGLVRSTKRASAGKSSSTRSGRRTRPATLLVELLETRDLLSVGWLNPVGTEFLVNTTVAGVQETTTNHTDAYHNRVNATAMDGQGNFVVVWHGNGPGDSDGIFAQRFAADGTPLGGETRVNVTTAGTQQPPLVARAAGGNYVVAWSSGGTVRARLFNGAGTPLTGEFEVSGKGGGFAVSVAMGDAGDFAVLYAGPAPGPSLKTWTVRRYNAAGAAQGGAIKVATPGLSNGTASIAMDADGDFVVAWDDDSIMAQRYSKTGKAVGSALALDPGADGTSWRSNVAMDGLGNFVVTWQHRGIALTEKLGQRVYANGTLAGSQFQFGVDGIDSVTAMALQDNGDVILAWQAFSTGQVYAQVFSSAGVSRGAPLLINTTTAGEHGVPSLTAKSGNLTIVWTGAGTGDDEGVFGQRFTVNSPLAAAAPSQSTTSASSSRTAFHAALNAALSDDDLLRSLGRSSHARRLHRHG